MENASATVTGNVLVGGVNSVVKIESLRFTNNFIASFWQDLAWTSPDTVIQQLIDNNTYYFYRNDCGRVPFDNAGNGFSIEQWTALGFDASSNINPCGTRPSGIKVDVRTNNYDTRRAHIIINNYAHAPFVFVNLSQVLVVGDSFEIRNSQDYLGQPVVSGIYTGAPVQLPMSGLAVARPNGWSSAMILSSAPDFGAFILIKK